MGKRVTFECQNVAVIHLESNDLNFVDSFSMLSQTRLSYFLFPSRDLLYDFNIL